MYSLRSQKVQKFTFGDDLLSGRKVRFEFTISTLRFELLFMDRMGNMITAYLTLLWMKLEFNYDVYLEKQSYLVSIFRDMFIEGKKSGKRNV